MTESEFEQLVEEALEDLPYKVIESMQNVVVVTAKNPDEEQMKEIGMRKGELLLGLYEGVPEIEWGKGMGNILPDKITIFQDSLEFLSKDEGKLKELVKETVEHEIAHHFGFTDEDLDAMGRG